MAENLRTTIKGLIRSHLKKKIGKVFGQCLTAVGWVGGTLPELYEKDGMVEVSMADVAKMAGTSYTFIENHYDHTDMSKLEEQEMKSFKVDKETGMIELGVRD